MIQKEIKLILYGCEIWSLTLREEKRLRVFERRLYNTELNDLYVRRILQGKPEGKRPEMIGKRNRDVWRAYVRTIMNLRVQ
ncbi:hypothetical protein C0J52_01478 [Blattella germanica]|nr:hypothetical protein C0J52_01478 [Blattella germanica]